MDRGADTSGAEAELLLACVSAQGPSRVRECLADAGSVDWDLSIRMAARHGVLPLLYRALEHEDAVPADAMARMKREFVANALNTLFLARELARLTRLCADAGVRTVALKGPVLALAAYGDTAMRQFSDLDILVTRAQVPKMAEILMGERYLPRRYRADAPGEALSRYFEDEFIKENGNHLVDLHWELTPAYFRYGPRADEALMRATALRIEGAEVLTLSPLDSILFLSVHGTKHGWVCLGWVVDLARMIAVNADLDFDALLARARQSGCMRMLLVGLTLAGKLADAALERSIVRLCEADRAAAALAGEVEARMFEQIEMRPGLFAEWAVPVRAIDSTRGRVNYVLRRAIGPTIEDSEFLELPERLYPLYYLVRPLRLALQQGRRLARDVPMAAPFRPRKAPR